MREGNFEKGKRRLFLFNPLSLFLLVVPLKQNEKPENPIQFFRVCDKKIKRKKAIAIRTRKTLGFKQMFVFLVLGKSSLLNSSW